MTEQINTESSMHLPDSDLQELQAIDNAFEGILALRARYDQLLRQRNSGGKWGIEEDTEFKRTAEYLGLIEDQQSRADKKGKSRGFGGRVLDRIIKRRNLR